MFDTGMISLVVAGVVAVIQIFTFFDSRSLRKEQSLSTFAKADLVKADLDAIRTSIDTKINHLFDLVSDTNAKITSIKEEINTNSTEIAVMKERITNDKEVICNIDDKLDKILDKI